MDIQAAIDAAALSPTREICGVMTFNPETETGAFVQLTNVADSDAEFAFDTSEYLAVSAIATIVHSHLPGSTVYPSQLDVEQCQLSGKPWLIVNGIGEYCHIMPDLPIPPLYGRPFIAHRFDCLTLIVDYYRWLGIVFPQSPQYDSVEFWRDGIDRVRQEFADFGFSEISMGQLQKNDVIVFQLGESTVPNHFGVYFGNNRFLEQRQGKLSGETVFGGWVADHAVLYLRHQAFL